MRTIAFSDIVNCVSKLCIDACYELPEDVLNAIIAAKKNEDSERAISILDQLIENARLAREERIPICQDTGLAVIFVKQGANTYIQPPADNASGTIMDAINQGVEKGYEEGLLRKSVVLEPLDKRKNSGTNTPCVIHHFVVPGDELQISMMAKGGGCENKSAFKMFNPTEDKSVIEEWIKQVVLEAGANACPPFVIGVGIGGDFEQCCFLSKKALLRDLDCFNEEPFYSEMEESLLSKINASGLGPQGLGGNTTALGVKIETAPCHIASLPVAVNIECHAHRHKHARI